MRKRLIVDAHQDIAYNAIELGRDFMLSAHETRRAELPSIVDQGPATVGLPDLMEANVRLVFATLFVSPCRSEIPKRNCYETPEQAYSLAKEQVAHYALLSMDPRVSLVTNRTDLASVSKRENCIGLVLLMEGADPILTPASLGEWYENGIRIIGPAWSATRYSGGTRAPGPLTLAGRELMAEMDKWGLVLDVSHMAEASFFEALDLFRGPVIASHSNCRKYVPTDRHLSDDMIRALLAREAVIGTVMFNSFLKAGWREAGKIKAEVTLGDVVTHIQRVCELAGDTRHSAIGSDFDGGFGAESIPAELDTAADLPLLGEALGAAGFNDADIDNIMGLNWMRLLERALPE